MTLDVYIHAFVPPGPPFSATTQEKVDYPRISTNQVDLKNYPVNHEVMGVYMVLTGTMPEGHTMKLNFNFYNDATNKLLYGGSGTIPQPSTGGWEWWNWYSWLAWIGRCYWEISGPMTVRVEVTSSGSPLGTEKKTVYMTVVDTATSSVKFQSIPPEVSIQVDGVYIGETPITSNKNALSSHTVAATKQNYVGQVKTIIWPDAGTLTYTFTLTPATPTYTIKETINWEAFVPTDYHTFYIFSLYGTNTNGTPEGFQIGKGVYQLITTPSMSRSDNLTTSNVSKFDCLTIISESFDGSTISGIYDWKIEDNVV